MCSCTDLGHDEVRRLILAKELKSIPGGDAGARVEDPGGCAKCRPALNYYLLCAWPGEYVDDSQSRFINERVHANIQKDGTYSVVPRMWGGVTNPRELRAIADVAEKFAIPTVKVTGGQRIDLLGVRKEDLPAVWADLGEAGMVSGHAYGKALRTVKTCVGTDWCRFGTQDSTGLGIRIEKFMWGSWTPAKVKMAVSGCPRNCAEATCKDFGVVCVDCGYEIHFGGAAGLDIKGTESSAGEDRRRGAGDDRRPRPALSRAGPLSRAHLQMGEAGRHRFDPPERRRGCREAQGALRALRPQPAILAARSLGRAGRRPRRARVPAARRPRLSRRPPNDDRFSAPPTAEWIDVGALDDIPRRGARVVKTRRGDDRRVPHGRRTRSSPSTTAARIAAARSARASSTVAPLPVRCTIGSSTSPPARRRAPMKAASAPCLQGARAAASSWRSPRCSARSPDGGADDGRRLRRDRERPAPIAASAAAWLPDATRKGAIDHRRRSRPSGEFRPALLEGLGARRDARPRRPAAPSGDRGPPVSWDAALDHVAATFARTIAEHGPDSVAFYVSGQLLTEDYYVANKLMKGFIGAANIDTNSRLCMASAVAGHRRAFGADVVPGNYEDLEEADLVVLVGSNLAWCHPVLYQRLVAAKERGRSSGSSSSIRAARRRPTPPTSISPSHPDTDVGPVPRPACLSGAQRRDRSGFHRPPYARTADGARRRARLST